MNSHCKTTHRREVQSPELQHKRQQDGWQNAQVVKCLPSKREALRSNPSTSKKKKKRQQEGKDHTQQGVTVAGPSGMANIPAQRILKSLTFRAKIDSREKKTTLA
jgi:hypothetical protein